MSSEDRDLKIEKMHREGERVSRIAKAFGLSEDTVRRILRERDLRSGAREKTGHRWAYANWEKARAGAKAQLERM